jgi:hypothetical protein
MPTLKSVHPIGWAFFYFYVEINLWLSI